MEDNLAPDKWIEENIKINNPKRGLIPFKLYDFQRKFIQDISDNRYVIANKFRMSGLTTLTIAYAIWDAIHSTRRIVFISNSDYSCVSLCNLAKQMINCLPALPKITNCTDHSIEFDNNSHIEFMTPILCCGRKIDHLYIDEAAFIQNMDEFWKVIWPCITEKITVTSTVNGVGNWFERTYNNALNLQNSFKAVKLNYKDHPDYANPEYEQKMKNALGDRYFAQEVLGLFLGKPTQTRAEKKAELFDELMDWIKRAMEL